jgi:hypothetical protein
MNLFLSSSSHELQQDAVLLCLFVGLPNTGERAVTRPCAPAGETEVATGLSSDEQVQKNIFNFIPLDCVEGN